MREMIKSKKEYNTIIERIEILLQNPNNIESQESKGYIELNILSDLVVEFFHNRCVFLRFNLLCILICFYIKIHKR